MNLEYTWLAEHPRKKAVFRGRYIAIVGDAIVASGSDLADVIAKAREHEKGDRKILISRVALKEVLTA
jgi:hypothetical protein